MTPLGKPGENPEKDASVPINWACAPASKCSAACNALPFERTSDRSGAQTTTTTVPGWAASTPSARRSRSAALPRIAGGQPLPVLCFSVRLAKWQTPGDVYGSGAHGMPTIMATVDKEDQAGRKFADVAQTKWFISVSLRRSH